MEIIRDSEFVQEGWDSALDIEPSAERPDLYELSIRQNVPPGEHTGELPVATILLSRDTAWTLVKALEKIALG